MCLESKYNFWIKNLGKGCYDNFSMHELFQLITKNLPRYQQYRNWYFLTSYFVHNTQNKKWQHLSQVPSSVHVWCTLFQMAGYFLSLLTRLEACCLLITHPDWWISFAIRNHAGWSNRDEYLLLVWQIERIFNLWSMGFEWV